MHKIIELKDKYNQLYKEMVDSKDTKNMMLFGSVMNELMEHAIDTNPSFAEQMLDKLESMNWHQYLTKSEAMEVCNKLEKKCQWPFETWERTLNTMSLETEAKPQFNKYALYVLMNIIYSKHAETLIQKILESTLQEISSEQMVSLVYGLAVDSLMDKSKMFDIRKYVSL